MKSFRLLGACAVLSIPSAAIAQNTKVGPSHGTVLVVGGGSLGPEVLGKFIELAGGPDAVIIDVPTAGGDSVYPADWQGTRPLKAAGAKHVVVLHTIDKKLADTDSFAAAIAKAGGVWFEGGRQWHLVDSYAGTKSEKAFHDVLARGGVVGGSSAGASILASYLLRGAREGNTIIMAPGYEEGFGLIKGVAIDQHMLTRNRQDDLEEVVAKHPDVLGIGLDESTAIVVRGQEFEVTGASKIAIHDGRSVAGERQQRNGKRYYFMAPGERYDLTKLERIGKRPASEP